MIYFRLAGGSGGTGPPWSKWSPLPSCFARWTAYNCPPNQPASHPRVNPSYHSAQRSSVGPFRRGGVASASSPSAASPCSEFSADVSCRNRLEKRRQKWLFTGMRGCPRDQDLAAQRAELMAAGCAKVFQEKVSGARTDRPGLAKVLRRLEPGDVLV